MKIGLRIDVDTWRGTRDGVPTLCRLLKKHDIAATFFFSAGPDNMGRHLWRLLKPQFALKMLRSNAPSLYGWDIIFRGTLWPGPLMAAGLAPVLRAARDDGHEIGLHAWDHHAWQMQVENAAAARVNHWLQRSYDAIEAAIAAAPTCAAAPAWRCTDTVLLERERFAFAFNSDCRGTTVFRPLVDGRPLKQLQVPNTLPTYDEMIGNNGVTNENYNEVLFGLLKSEGLNVLTIHAEAEGGVCAGLFEKFVEKVLQSGAQFVPLGQLAREAESGPGAMPEASIAKEIVPGREGWISVQGR